MVAFLEGVSPPPKKSGPGVTAPWRFVKGLLHFEIIIRIRIAICDDNFSHFFGDFLSANKQDRPDLKSLARIVCSLVYILSINPWLDVFIFEP